MQLILNRRTDYGFRAMLALARARGERRSARRIAADVAIPPTFVGPIMADLMRAGLVSGTPGRGGGYELAVDPSSSSAMSSPHWSPVRARPIASLADRMCGPAAQCAMHPIWAAASAAYLETFGSVTLATLAATDEALREGGLS